MPMPMQEVMESHEIELDGKTYQLKASLPRGTPPPLNKYGPDECQMAELANGTILYNARNNWGAVGGAKAAYRLKTTSTE